MEDEANREIRRFGEAVTLALGHRQWPLAMAGDLSDLLFTLENGAALLRELLEETSREKIPSLLHRVSFLLTEELPPIARDLLPALEKVETEARTLLEKG